jgi:aryl-alcohol dehydrogenase-like predicted oxidoreductase
VIQRTLGRTGIRVSAIAFGAGPVSGLMTGSDAVAQRDTVARAIELGINWFDTAAGYGEGRSEENLGRVLAELPAENVHVATKVRVPLDSPERICNAIRRSVSESLRRLKRDRVTLLQLHNGITNSRGDAPASITPADVLGPVAETFQRLQLQGLVRFIGITGIGQAPAIREVIRSGLFDAIQSPFNILNPSAAAQGAVPEGETDYGQIFANCVEQQMGVFAIRVLAGGAILGRPPSEHTLRTPYFPRDLYQRDLERARQLPTEDPDEVSNLELAVRFVLRSPVVSSAIIGFASADQVEQVARINL